MLKKSFQIIGVVIGVLLLIYIIYQFRLTSLISINGPITKIAFLRNQEVWTVNSNGKNLKQITFTDGKVEQFLFSKSSRYLAYLHINGYVDDWGDDYLEGERIPQISDCSLKIVDLKKRRVLKEIPPQGEIHIEKWVADQKLLFYTAAAGAVMSEEEYDIKTDSINSLEYSEWEQINSIETESHILKNKEALFLKTGANDWYNRYLEWSFDDRFLLIFTQGQAFLIEPQNQLVIQKIIGSNFLWVSNNQIMIEDGGDLFSFDLKTRKKKLFLIGATDIQLCGSGSKIFNH